MINKRGFLQTIAGFFAGAGAVGVAKADVARSEVTWAAGNRREDRAAAQSIRKEGELWVEIIPSVSEIYPKGFKILVTKTQVNGEELIISVVSHHDDHWKRVVEYHEGKRDNVYG